MCVVGVFLGFAGWAACGIAALIAFIVGAGAATNVTGEEVTDPEQIRSFLASQVCSPVRWEKSMRGALARGISKFIEPGPGKVLTGLMGRIDSEAQVRSIAVPGDLEES